MKCASTGRSPAPRLARHLHRLGPHAQHQLVPGRQRRVEPRRAARPESRRPCPPPSATRGRAALGPHLRRHDVHHRRADELRHEEVDRVQVHLRRRAHLLQHPVVHHRHPVGEAHRLHLVVGDVDAGGAVLDVQPLQLGAHVLAQLGVERADRLVHQQRLRPPHQRPADRHPLHVAARELRRPLAEQRARSAATPPRRAPCARSPPRLSPVARSGKAMFSKAVRCG